MPDAKANEMEPHSIRHEYCKNRCLVNALGVANLDPTALEPPVVQESYYLLYRASEDSGTTWQLDEPLFRLVDKQMKEDYQGAIRYISFYAD